MESPLKAFSKNNKKKSEIVSILLLKKMLQHISNTAFPEVNKQ